MWRWRAAATATGRGPDAGAAVPDGGAAGDGAASGTSPSVAPLNEALALQIEVNRALGDPFLAGKPAASRAAVEGAAPRVQTVQQRLFAGFPGLVGACWMILNTSGSAAGLDLRGAAQPREHEHRERSHDGSRSRRRSSPGAAS